MRMYHKLHPYLSVLLVHLIGAERKHSRLQPAAVCSLFGFVSRLAVLVLVRTICVPCAAPTRRTVYRQ